MHASQLRTCRTVSIFALPLPRAGEGAGKSRRETRDAEKGREGDAGPQSHLLRVSSERGRAACESTRRTALPLDHAFRRDGECESARGPVDALHSLASTRTLPAACVRARVQDRARQCTRARPLAPLPAFEGDWLARPPLVSFNLVHRPIPTPPRPSQSARRHARSTEPWRTTLRRSQISRACSRAPPEQPPAPQCPRPTRSCTPSQPATAST